MHGQLSSGLIVMTASCSCCVCSALSWLCLMRVDRFAIPLAAVLLLPRHSVDCCHGDRRWI